MRYHELISEAPIDHLEKLGDWQGDIDQSSVSSPLDPWGATDRKLLSTPRHLKRLSTAWNRTPYRFNQFLVRGPTSFRNVEYGEINATDLSSVVGPSITNTILARHAAQTITLVHSNNVSDEHMPFTAWIMAHRTAHAICAGGINIYREEFIYAMASMVRAGEIAIYGKEGANDVEKLEDDITNDDSAFMTTFVMPTMTMLSARQGKVNNMHEAFHEMLAQFIIEGRVSFNAFGFELAGQATPHRAFANRLLTKCYAMINRICEFVLRDAVGKIYLM